MVKFQSVECDPSQQLSWPNPSASNDVKGSDSSLIDSALQPADDRVRVLDTSTDLFGAIKTPERVQGVATYLLPPMKRQKLDAEEASAICVDQALLLKDEIENQDVNIPMESLARGWFASNSPTSTSLNEPTLITLTNGVTIKVTSSESVHTPQRQTIDDPATYMPESFIKVERLEDDTASIQCPEKWRILGHLIYMFVTSNGEILVGRTKNVAKRLSSYQTAFNGHGKARLRSLAMAWAAGQEAYFSILYVCSSERSAKQNETSFIVSKGSTHNKNRANGNPTVVFGSPLKNGKGGLPPEVFSESNRSYRELPVVEDLKTLTPKKYVKVEYNNQTDRYSINLPPEWKTLQSVIYQWKTPEDDRRLVGETGRPLCKRISEYVSSFNAPEDQDMHVLSKALKEGKEVWLGLLAIAPPEYRRQFEGDIIRGKATLKPNGFNVRSEGDPNVVPTSPLRHVPETANAIPIRPAPQPSLQRVTPAKRKLFD